MSEGLTQLDKREAIGVIIALSVGFIALASTLDIEVLAEIFAIVGFVVLLPLVGILGDRLPFITAGEDDATDSAVTDRGIGEPNGSDDRDGQITTLRERYARGEIDESEFEHRLEALLETEDIDAAPGTSREGVTDHEGPTDHERDGATDRDRSVEPE